MLDTTPGPEGTKTRAGFWKDTTQHLCAPGGEEGQHPMRKRQLWALLGVESCLWLHQLQDLRPLTPSLRLSVSGASSFLPCLPCPRSACGLEWAGDCSLRHTRVIRGILSAHQRQPLCPQMDPSRGTCRGLRAFHSVLSPGFLQPQLFHLHNRQIARPHRAEAQGALVGRGWVQQSDV